MDHNSPGKPRIIKKYGSRRLYDTVGSAYISFAQLGKIIADGFMVQVIDAKTREDVTQQTLSSYCIENMMVLDFCSCDLLKLIIKAQSYSTEQKNLVMSIFGNAFNLAMPQDYDKNDHSSLHTKT